MLLLYDSYNYSSKCFFCVLPCLEWFVQSFKGCVHYIFASLFFMSK